MKFGGKLNQAPITVRNFLKYAGIGYYNNSIIHRSMPGFVVQGGGYVPTMTFLGLSYTEPTLGKFQSIQNEFSPSRSNAKGTIAMAKLGGKPNSATSEWFFNLADNNAPYDPNKSDSEQSLDYQNGGFTVFGRVLDTGPGTGMDIVDAIAKLYVCKTIIFLNTVVDPACSVYNSAFTDLPVDSYDPAIGLQPSNLVTVNRIPNVASGRTDLGTIPTFTADVDMVFDLNLVGSVTNDFALKLLKSFSSPQNETVYFNNGIHTFTVGGVIGPAGRIVTLHDGATTRPNRYYAYGKTPDNQSDHWYDFSYDSATGTGAKIEGDKILLYFKDGQRGDEDLKENGSITHTGAQAVVTATTTSNNPSSGGCSIATTPKSALRAGDWMLVSLFLTMLALRRKKFRHLALTPALSRRERE